MADAKAQASFPDISEKLAAPSKKSVFERRKAEEEAKKQRENAEAEAALADFRKAFGDDEPDLVSKNINTFNGPSSGRGSGGGGAGGGSRRYFGTPVGKERSSGPGTLGPLPSSGLKKRTADGGSTYGRLDSADTGAITVSEAFDSRATSQPDESRTENEVARPTVQMLNLPPRTTDKEVKRNFPRSLQIHDVALLPAAASGSRDRRSVTAIVTFKEHATAKDIDKAVNDLQNRYLGFGYRLSISRYLSSAALNNFGAPSLSTKASQPFGATKVQIGPAPTLSRAPPPQTYGQGQGSRYGRAPAERDPPPPPEEFRVVVEPPSDITQLRLIHQTIEGILTHGEAFEALLMANAEVQLDEAWSWLFDPRSRGAVYYRWKLWTVLTGAFADEARPRHTYFAAAETHVLFDDGMKWQKPKEGLPFEFTNNFEDLTLVSDYSTDSGESDDGEDEQKPLNGSDEAGILNPMDRAKLVFFLATLPTSTSRLMRGDIAAITWFVVDHADQGAAEVVELIINNIESPLALDSELVGNGNGYNDSGDEDMMDADHQQEREDPSSAKLVALYVLSDILFASSSSGIRGAWRFRSAFEAALAERRTFISLGRLDRELGWGKMKAEKWRRAVDQVLSLWEGQNCFASETQKLFREQFENPPLTMEEQAQLEAEERRKAEAQAKVKINFEKINLKKPGDQSETDSLERVDDDNAREADEVDWDVERTPELSEIEDTEDEAIDGELMPDSDDEIEQPVQGEKEPQTPGALAANPSQARQKMADISQRLKTAMEKRGVVLNKKPDDVDMFAMDEAGS